MKLKSLETEQEYDDMMVWVNEQLARKVPPDSPEGNTLQVALRLIEAYEDKHYPIRQTHF